MTTRRIVWASCILMAVSVSFGNQAFPQSSPMNFLSKGAANQGVFIGISEVDPEFDDRGHVTECAVKVLVQNKTQYHINKITYTIGVDDNNASQLNESVPSVPANAAIRPDFSIELSNDSSDCADLSEYILENIRSARAFDCSMGSQGQPGPTEGDCQNMVQFSTAITESSISKVKAAEQKKEQEITNKIADICQKTASQRQAWNACYTSCTTGGLPAGLAHNVMGCMDECTSKIGINPDNYLHCE